MKSDARLRRLRCKLCTEWFVGHYAARYCKTCQPARRKRNVQNHTERWKGTPEAAAKSHNKKLRQRLSMFGLTIDDYNDVLKKQDSKCAICRREFDLSGQRSGNPLAPHKDHDHATGAFRGLLCGSCNKGLGLLGDNADGINKAQRYLATSWRVRTFK